MSLYAIIGHDRPDSLEARRAARPAHLARVQELVTAGRLVIAGPLPRVDTNEPTPAGFAGSLIVAEFATLQEAQNWVAQDPYVTGGVFTSCEVHPFTQVLP